jgi:8-oxo-dGTP pyrophosphatase MutT (NUDIX family)
MDSRPIIRIAAAVIVDGFGRVLLVRKRGTTAFMQPGGKVMLDETAVEAMQREIAEELGVAVTASATRSLGRHVAEAANEPGHLVEAELFSVSLDGQLFDIRVNAGVHGETRGAHPVDGRQHLVADRIRFDEDDPVRFGVAQRRQQAPDVGQRPGRSVVHVVEYRAHLWVGIGGHPPSHLHPQHDRRHVVCHQVVQFPGNGGAFVRAGAGLHLR